MKKNVLVIAAAKGMLLASCSKKEKPAETTISEVTKTEVKTDSTSTESGIDDSHNAQNSLDWAGTYEGTVPCADCPGIKTTITLNDNGSFAIAEEYLERKTKSEDKGKFEWDKSGSRITLNGKDTKRQYFVGENQLFQLDTEGKEITGPNKDLYILKKK
ncbi:copper resistance protein NlpE N-terminal domain-containing protein [Elizabethkingia meningoseptica]|uniref:copper resistance protein NlpE n=1 Tax=Elizabethkingia meningoseptica TaxID=238 RepID=UPI0018C350DE|nr:copper resistance protein NlpE [Elizabethkingia meningoseptica]MBG0515936.1 copper resistance protein NlpE N-terminal domain-containing protein [Elizabethkingia meningoseptica]